MPLKFTGRESQLTEIENLVKAKQGAVFAVSGNAGIGKSTLLKEVARLYPKTGQVFIDINKEIIDENKLKTRFKNGFGDISKASANANFSQN